MQLDVSAVDDPVGVNLGDGLTGSSVKDAGAWQPESVDLSAFAGKHILVRFEVVMDELDDQEGLAVANVAIPAIGYADSGQDTSGWASQGWLRTANLLPEVCNTGGAFPQNGDAPQVQAMKVDAAGNGRLTIPHFGAQIGRVLVAIAPMAPSTQSHHQLHTTHQRHVIACYTFGATRAGHIIAGEWGPIWERYWELTLGELTLAHR